MKTGSKGKLAESLVLSELLKRGFRVAIPFGECRYDLVIEKEGVFKRIQVKYVGGATKRSTVPIILHSISRKGRVLYSADEVDFIVAYYQPINTFYIIPHKDVAGKTVLNLRLKEAANKQLAGVVLASQYEQNWDLLTS